MRQRIRNILLEVANSNIQKIEYPYGYIEYEKHDDHMSVTIHRIFTNTESRGRGHAFEMLSDFVDKFGEDYKIVMTVHPDGYRDDVEEYHRKKDALIRISERLGFESEVDGEDVYRTDRIRPPQKKT